MEIYDKVSKHHELLNWNSETVKYYICEHPYIRPAANSSFTFSAKERDTETGYSVTSLRSVSSSSLSQAQTSLAWHSLIRRFGSRYYSSDLSIWLSVDPQASKYPSLSPYVYCANNPVRLVDPNGEEVEYNSFADRILVGLHRLFNGKFRQQFKELKNSEETYVFNKNNDGNNSFTTDGNKLYINYSIDDNGKSKNAGQTVFSNLRHETTHAIQFEYGEIGFSFRGIGYGIIDRDGNYFELKKWQPFAYDLTDEYEAHNNQNFGFRWNSGINDSRSQWKKSNREIRMQGLQNTKGYVNLPNRPLNCPNDVKIKSDNYYALPHRDRPQNLSYGKSFVERHIFLNQDNDTADYEPVVFYPSISILRNDTVFCYALFYTKNVIDSITLQYFSVKKRGSKYIRTFNDGCIWIIRYKKVKTHSFQKIEMLNLKAYKIVEPRSIFRYNAEGKLTEYFFSFCGFSFSKQLLNSPH